MWFYRAKANYYDDGRKSWFCKINVQLRGALPTLLKDFQLVHICGKGNIDKN